MARPGKQGKGQAKGEAPAPAQDAETEDSEFDEEDAPASLPGKLSGKNDFDLEDLVARPAWKELLFRLVVEEGLDPWNIDVGLIAAKYLESIKKLQVRDLRIPANIILAASILLRFKSDAIRLEEQVQEVETETFIGEGQPVEIPLLTLRTRIPPKRKVTLEELVGALEDVFRDQRKREDWKARPEVEEALVIQLPEFNIENQMAEVHEKVKGTADSQGLSTFSRLLKEGSRQEKVFTLLPLLFLAQEGKVNLFQEKFFGEIFIQLKTPAKSAPRKGAKPKEAGEEGDEDNEMKPGARAGRKGKEARLPD